MIKIDEYIQLIYAISTYEHILDTKCIGWRQISENNMNVHILSIFIF